MRVVIVNDMLWGGGRERRIVQLIAGLNAQGINDITLVLLDARIDYPEVYDLNVKILKILRNGNRDFSVFPKLYQILKRIGPSIVNPWSYMSVFYAAPVCKLLGIPCVGAYVVDAKAPQSWSINWLAMHIGFRWCSKIIGNSKAGHIAYNTPKTKSIVIYNGFNFDRLKSNRFVRASGRKNSSNCITIAMIGRLDRQKDYVTYVDGLYILMKRGYDFAAYVVGQGELREELESYAQARCGDKIIFTGFVGDVDDFIPCVDISVLCTDPDYHAEGISNSILESMANGKPVVATHGGGTPEIVIDGYTGYLVPPRDPLALADRLQDLCDSHERRVQFGENGARRIAESFNLSRMSSAFLEVYRESSGQ